MNNLEASHCVVEYLKARLTTPWYSEQMRRVVRHLIRNAPDYFIDVLFITPHTLDKLAAQEYKEIVLEMMGEIPMTTRKDQMGK